MHTQAQGVSQNIHTSIELLLRHEKNANRGVDGDHHCAIHRLVDRRSCRANAEPFSIDAYLKSAQEQYKKDRDAFMAAIRDREMKMRSINATFKAAVDKSALDAKAALTTATTPEQKNAINSTRRAALAAAIVARESAIAALGAMPTPPVEPMRPSHTMMVPEQKGKQKR
jgi:hypothetical protein